MFFIGGRTNTTKEQNDECPSKTDKPTKNPSSSYKARIFHFNISCLYIPKYPRRTYMLVDLNFIKLRSRSQRRVENNIVGRKISKKTYLEIKSPLTEENNIFEFMSHNVLIRSSFFMAQRTIAVRFGVCRKSVNEWIGRWVRLGYFTKINRFNKSCIYRATSFLKMVIMALAPLMPSLSCMHSHDINKLQIGLGYTIVNKEIILPLGNNIIDLYSYYTTYERSAIRADEQRNAVMSLLAMGPQRSNGKNLTWIRGNAPEWDNESLVEKERAMSRENYEALQRLERQERIDRKQSYWRDPQTTRGPSAIKSVQNHGSNDNESHEREQAPRLYVKQQRESHTLEDSRRGNVSTAYTKNVRQSSNIKQQNKIWQDPEKDVIPLNEDVERQKFEAYWDSFTPEKKALCKRMGLHDLALYSFYKSLGESK